MDQATLERMVIMRSMATVGRLHDDLAIVIDQAEQGNPAARHMLGILLSDLDHARAASKGIALPSGNGHGGR